MDFNNIIIQGITNSDNKSNLKSYFIREFKKAERDNFYSVDDFFNPLLRKVDSLKNELHEKFIKTEKAYKSIIQKAKKNEHNFHDKYLTNCIDKYGISYEHYKAQENKKCLAVTTKKLAEFEINKIYTQVYFTQINFAHVLLIENGLNEAKAEIEPTKEPFNVDKFEFRPDIFLQSKADFKNHLIESYGNQHHEEELQQIVDKFYNENRGYYLNEAKQYNFFTKYNESIRHGTIFRLSMADPESPLHRIKIINSWYEAQLKYINENQLDKSYKLTNDLFRSYISSIFAIYRKVYERRENKSKSIGQIEQRHYELKNTIQKKTEKFILYADYQVIKGNGNQVWLLKKYVVCLFKELEYELKRAGIEIDRSPLKEVIDAAIKTINNGISFNEIKELTPTEVKHKNIENLSTQTEKLKSTIILRPVLNATEVVKVFEILKSFFEPMQHQELQRLLKTFENANQKLVFKSDGNKLTDTFKKLIENDFITGCQKKSLIHWITSNFQYVYRGNIKDYKTKTVESTISGHQSPCKKPIIKISGGQILKIDY